MPMNLITRFRSLFRRDKLEADMVAEMRAHIDAQTQRNLAAGMAPDDACAAAHRQFGGVAQIQERARVDHRRGFVWLDNLARDAGFAVRTLRKSPGFTSVVVLTLALGIGVNMTLFTWFNAAAFRPLPVRDPAQLFTLTRLDERGNETEGMSYTDYVTYREHQTVLSGLAAMASRQVELADAAEFHTATGEKLGGLQIETVSANYFTVFGVPIARGRPLVAADETSSSSALPVIVISHRFWQNHFGGDPDVIGRTLRLRGLAGETLTIVGVAGPEFYGTRPGALAGWVPLQLRPGDAWRTDLKATNFWLTGRVRPGLAPEQAAEELQVIANEFLARPHPRADTRETIGLTSAATYLNLDKQMMPVLLPLICLFGAVLLISCANASNLILARAVTRQFEFAVRGALGATRRRLFSLLMTESLLLGLLGGLAGWAIAAALLRFVWPWLLDMMPGAREGTAGLYLHADYRVLAFTLAVSILAGAAGGLFPALQVTRRNVVSALNREGSAFGRKLRLSQVRGFLAVGQLALSSALLFTAGLLVHRALQISFQDVGFEKSRLVTLEVLAPRTYEPGQIDSARRQVLERISALPEVIAVSEMPRFPFAPSRATVSIPAQGTQDSHAVYVLHGGIPANYFDTLQLTLVRGRPFAAHELPSDRVAVISETAEREFWPGGDALGQHFEVPTSMLMERETPVTAPAAELSPDRTLVTVIGIARDTRVYDTFSGDRPFVYLPLPPQTGAAPYLLIRTSNLAELPLAALQQVGRDVTGIAPRIVTVDDLFEGAAIQYRISACVSGILAALSLIVAVTGLYGVMSFTVSQRVKEIGIRIALGATPRSVASVIVFQCLRLVGLGAAAGYLLSVVIALAARALLQGVGAFDPMAGFAVVLFLATVGVFACWMPARRASRVDPVVALRAE